MPNYIIAYYEGQKFESSEDEKKHREKWQTWVENLGEAAINPGTPLMKSKTVSADAVTEGGQLNGFSVVRAGDIEAALEIAKSCPYVEVGTLQVAEMLEMK